MSTVKILVISDNHVQRGDLLAEHGLCYWIECGNERLLFDTGQGNVLLHNAYRLGVDLKTTRNIVLSHGHYDHTNGLVDAVRGEHPLQLWLHPAAIEPKYRCSENAPAKPIGISSLAKQVLQRKNIFSEWTQKPQEIIPGLFVTGEIPRRNDFEKQEDSFFLDKNGECPDPIRDDQALFFRTEKGLVVLLGCAHAGVVNTIQYIESLAPNDPIHAVLGGMHLSQASPERLAATTDALGKRPIELLSPAHCTGMEAVFHLWNAFGNRCVPSVVGAEYRFRIDHSLKLKASPD